MEKFASASSNNGSSTNNNEDDGGDAWDANGENNNHFPSGAAASKIGHSSVVVVGGGETALKQEREAERANLTQKTNLFVNGETKSGNASGGGGKDLKSLAKVVNQLTAIRSKELETKGMTWADRL